MEGAVYGITPIHQAEKNTAYYLSTLVEDAELKGVDTKYPPKDDTFGF
jgi:hypothetical protein